MKPSLRKLRLSIVLVLLLSGIAMLGITANGISTTQARSQSADRAPDPAIQAPRLASIAQAVRSDTSPPLRDIPPVAPRPGQPDNENNRIPNRDSSNAIDSVRQTALGPLVMPTPIITWDGMYNQYGPIPPDTIGDIGRTQYVQLVNTGIQVFDKNTGASIFGPVNLNTIWYRFGGFCEIYNNGDPIVLYDSMADRWMLSQFAYASTSGPTFQCIAISTSPDAAGSYYRYAFESTTVGFDDYPHYGVWPDAYYMTANRFGGPNGFAGANIAFERPRMLVGDPTARMIGYEVVGNGGALPADLDGFMPPPAGSPNYIWYPTSAAAGRIDEYKFHVDWSNPGNSTFTGPFQITVAPWDADLCTATREQCIDQPGTTARLEAISDRFMHRLAYRNFGTHESLVVKHTVDGSGTGIAGIRWYEVRDPNGARTVFQQGTFAPADGIHRWMGSISMDRQGNMAAGYSVSSSSVFPSIRYAGRLVSDPPGQFTQGEATMWNGTGSEDFPAAPRWGDYSSINVDPVDDCTFYYTTEYFAQTGLRNWRTRIGSFRFPGCTGATATPAATSTAGPSLTPLPPTATPCPGGVTYSGSIAAGDPTQNGRLGVGSPASTCAAPRPVPAFSDQLTRRYDQYSYTNGTASAQCVTVYVTQACGDNAVQSIAYLNTFDPANIQANYLAHGGAAGPSYQYSFTLAAGATARVIMLEVTPNIDCATYSLTISPCATGPITPSPTAPPVTPSPTVCVPTYVAATATATMIPGGTDIGNHCDDCTTAITLPFSVNIYGSTYTTARVSSNGNVQFASNNPNIYNPNCIPVSASPPFLSTIFAYYDDLRTDELTACPACGIFTQTIGAAPNRQYVIRWRTTFYDFPGEAEFEVVLTEGSGTVSVIYGPSVNNGETASSGMQYDATRFTQFSCDTASLTNGLRVDFNPTGCATPTPVSTATGTATSTALATATSCPMTFTDVDRYNPFYIYIRCLYCRGIVSGYADNTFRPYNNLTRGQAAKVVSNAAGITDAVSGQRYVDVPTSHPFYLWIMRLTNRGYMGGYSTCPGTGTPCFRPEQNVTRGQLAKIVSNAAQFTDSIPSTVQSFADVPSSNTFWLWIERLSRRGIISGYDCGTGYINPCTGVAETCDSTRRPYYRWCANVTRGQASKIVANTFFPINCAPGSPGILPGK
jgi:hypothetical protein